MRRSGPLQDLPLDQFLPPNPNVPTSPFKSARGTKRSLPPSACSFFSPAKRRILNAEGILCSSEMSLKSPVSASSRARQSPARFADLVRGPDSPARRLDFGLPKNHSQSTAGNTTVVNSAASSQFEAALDMTPTRTSSTTTNLAPSPELVAPKASSSSFPLDEPEMDDYFSPHLPRHSSIIPTMVPRELPPPPDRQSSNYPGFDVYPDTHIPLLLARSASADSTDSGSESGKDRDGCKENVAPKRKMKKSATTPTSSELTKAGLLSPEGKQRAIEKEGRFQSTPATPKKTRLGVREGGAASPTPRRPGVHDLLPQTLAMLGSARKERMERRRMLEDEVDEAGSDEDEML